MLIQRYYNPIDAGHALFDIVADSFFAISNVLGVSRKKTFITQAMELFEIGAEINPNATNTIVNFIYFLPAVFPDFSHAKYGV